MITIDNSRMCTVEVTITESCNRNCKYCFEGNYNRHHVRDEDEEDRQVKLIADFCANFPRDKFDTLKIIFWGGEPMMNLDFVLKIVRATHQYDFVLYFVYTNGTMTKKWTEFLDSEYITSLDRSRLWIRLSYDGEPVQTKMRGGGRDAVKTLMERLVRDGFLVYPKATVSFSCIGDIMETWQDYAKLQSEIPCLRFSPIFDTMVDDDSSIDLFKKEVQEMAKHEYDFYLKHGFVLCDWFDADSDQYKGRNCVDDNFICMHTDGNFYMCYGVKSMPWGSSYILGNTKDCKGLGSMFRKWNFGEINEECATCEAINCFVCHAGNLPYPKDASEIEALWHRNRNGQHKRCLYYKYLGRMNRLFWEAVKANDISVLNKEV